MTSGYGFDESTKAAFTAMASHVNALVEGKIPTDTTPITKRLDDLIKLLAQNSGANPVGGGTCGTATSTILSTLNNLSIASPSPETLDIRQILTKWCEDSANKGFPDARLPALTPLLVKGDYSGDAEGELRDLAVQMFRISLSSRAFDASVIGAAQLGSTALVRFALAKDGLALANSDIDHQSMRYLYKAWMSRNKQGRGLHFLRTYLQLQFDWFEADQLWHKKTEPYPSALTPKFLIKKGTEQDYYLTSRLAIFIRYREPDVGNVVRVIRDVAPSVLPARLIPDDVNVGVFVPSSNGISAGNSAHIEIESAADVSTSVAVIGVCEGFSAIGCATHIEIESGAEVNAHPFAAGQSKCVMASANSAHIEVESVADMDASSPQFGVLSGMLSAISAFGISIELNWSFA